MRGRQRFRLGDGKSEVTDLGLRVKLWRRQVGASQDAFAKATGLPLQTLKGYELGHRQPGAEALTAIAGTGVNINWLLTGQGPMRALQAGQPAPPPPAGTSTAPNQAANSPTALPAALQPLERRIGAVLGMLGNLPELEAAALLDEFAARASTQQQLSELRQAVQQLSFANGKRA